MKLSDTKAMAALEKELRKDASARAAQLRRKNDRIAEQVSRAIEQTPLTAPRFTSR